MRSPVFRAGYYRIRCKTRIRIRSLSPTKAPSTITDMITTKVDSCSSVRVGQADFFSSRPTSLIKPTSLTIKTWILFTAQYPLSTGYNQRGWLQPARPHKAHSFPWPCLVISPQSPCYPCHQPPPAHGHLAGEGGFEPSTPGFGDRYSAN